MEPVVNIFEKARRHLARRDPILKAVIKLVGPCTLTPNAEDRLGMLVRAIVGQQISGKAAAAINGRLVQAMGKRGISARRLLNASDDLLRTAGLSGSKMKSLRDLADKVHTKVVPLEMLHDLEDEEVIERLIPVRGIGRWTAQMFLIFALGRMDVLPVDDLGLRAGVRRHYGLTDLPKKDELTKVAEPWQPYRSVATWYMWRSFEPVPQSAAKE